MTDKVTLTNLSNLQNDSTATTAINANNAAITTAMDNTLSRDGTTPNTMGASLDMNSNRIINLGAPVSSNDAVRFSDTGNLSASITAVQTASAGVATSAALTLTASSGAATSSSGAASSATAAASSATAAASSATAAASSASSAANSISGNLYTFSSTTTSTGMTTATGTLRFNNSSPASATNIFLTATTADAGNPDIHAYSKTWGDSTNTAIKGYILVKKQSAPATFAIYNTNAAVTDNTTWENIPVTYVTGAGSFTTADTLIVEFTPAGNKGSDGSGVAGQTQYSVAVASGASTLLAGGVGVGNAGQVIISQGAGSYPTMNTIAGHATLTASGTLTLTSNASILQNTGTWKTFYTDGSSVLQQTSIGSSGQLLLAQTVSTAPAWGTVSGDATITNAGAVTVSKIGGCGVTVSVGAVSIVPSAASVSFYDNIPQNSVSASYTTVLGDAQKHIFHPSADTSARVWTIASNGAVAYPVGTTLTFINQTAGGVISIAITGDTLRLAGPGTTGSRTLAANGMATAVKVTTTEWIISGVGLT